MFKREKDFIKNIEKITNNLYSVVEYLDPVKVTPNMLIEKNYLIKLLDSFSLEGKIHHQEGIFETPSGFFIYLSKNISEDIYRMKIIYKSSQLDEVSMFIKNLLKLK
jgi:hypothetical protein